MTGPVLHLAVVAAVAAVLAIVGLEAWHALEHALAGAGL